MRKVAVIVGQTSGSVMWNAVETGPAPAIAEASSSEASIERSAASIATNTNAM